MEHPVASGILLLVFCLCIIWLFIYFIRGKCGKKEDPLDPTQDIEKGTKDTTPIMNNTELTKSIPMRPRLYSEVPVLVKPLTPPRAVVLLEDIHSMLTDEERFEIFMMNIRSVQQNLKTATMSSLKCNLVIGVHASTERIAGYCVNLVDNSCQIYTYDPSCLPWEIEEEVDMVEIGAKNLLFALMLWEKDIVKGKKVRIYAGSGTIVSDLEYQDVQKVLALMSHYQTCTKVSWVNEKDMYILDSEGETESDDSSEFDPYNLKEEDFQKLAKFIQPAVDLCHWRIKLCERHLSNFYGIEPSRFYNTHRQTKWNKVECRPLLETTCAYDEFLEKVKRSLAEWVRPCRKCGLGLDDACG